MASNFSTIGLPVASSQDLTELANRIGPLAERMDAPGGAYFRWSDPSGAEIWLQVNENDDLVGMNPHYAGRSAVRVGLTSRRASAGPSRLDGSFHGWAAPVDEADSGSYPFVFDAPDYRLHERLSLPSHKDVQIAAFAREIAAFETVAAFDASQTGDLKYASQSFIPSGLFTPDGDSRVPPQARAIFTGHVLAADEKINTQTGHVFYWALVETYGGAYDVVIDSSLLPRAPIVGGIVSGSFWLSGRIIAGTKSDHH
ncbi:hypothetical protein [Bradyrhizobium sp. cf659]|uniref:hypothetical protein n=1 Tax=Bradyrhizobium sp. cf659 TaxID=1761771 RepID=UPI0008E50A16|nr:hypothetical protein [Bradyrhizobium sp. cf659]SFH98283.1 hypothetical protein SAMN04487925_1011394 [Bradyrhizobium sp. cf659]